VDVQPRTAVLSALVLSDSTITTSPRHPTSRHAGLSLKLLCLDISFLLSAFSP
jgi:hypothetical protein